MKAPYLTLALAATLPSRAPAQAAARSHPESEAVAVREEFDPVAIMELGGAFARDSRGGSTTAGPNLAAEVTPIGDVLELEAGITPVFRRHSTEWDADFLFKKPWTLSKTAEFMLGVGPELEMVRQNGLTSATVSGEIAADFMYWPGGGHHVGWFVEPAYDYSFATGHAQAFGMSGGLLIGIP